MNISFVTYLEKYFNLQYEDYLLISSNEKRAFYFEEYQRFIYDGKFNINIHKY